MFGATCVLLHRRNERAICRAAAAAKRLCAPTNRLSGVASLFANEAATCRAADAPAAATINKCRPGQVVKSATAANFNSPKLLLRNYLRTNLIGFRVLFFGWRQVQRVPAELRKQSARLAAFLRGGASWRASFVRVPLTANVSSRHRLFCACVWPCKSRATANNRLARNTRQVAAKRRKKRRTRKKETNKEARRLELRRLELSRRWRLPEEAVVPTHFGQLLPFLLLLLLL